MLNKIKNYFKHIFCACKRAKNLGNYLDIVKSYKIFYMTERPGSGLDSYIIQCNNCKHRQLFSATYSLSYLVDQFDKINHRERKDMELEDFYQILKNECKKHAIECKEHHWRGSELFLSDLVDNNDNILKEGYTVIGSKFMEGQSFRCCFLNDRHKDKPIVITHDEIKAIRGEK